VVVSWGGEGARTVVATIVSSTSGTISETASRAGDPSLATVSGTAYKLQVKTRSRVCIHKLPRTL
jgi:hypothetical protein